MKTIITTAVLSVVAVAGALAAGAPTMTCTLQNGAPCTAQNVKNLQNNLTHSATGSRSALADVKALSVSANGTLKCEQANGKPCTTQQINMILEVSANSDLTVKVSK